MDPKKLDSYYFKAKKEGYLARSIYKLKEIDEKYRILQQGHRVLDLGAAPGSWMQYAAQKIGDRGLLVGIDLNPIQIPSTDRILTIQGDILTYPFADLTKEHGLFHAVVSDVAPKTTGQRDRDHEVSIELCNMAFDVALKSLRTGGSFVSKMYQGEHLKPFLQRLRPHFDMVKSQKPASSRSESKEVFVVGLKFTSSRNSTPKT